MLLFKQKNQGFTLIETLVTIFIFALSLGAIFGFIYYGYRSQSYTLQQAQAIQSARKGLETMVREIREASQADNGAYAIEDASGNSLIFYSDIDKDDQTERVRYFLEGTEFKKGIIQPQGNPVSYPPETEAVSTISEYVINDQPSVFSYYDGEYPTSSEPLQMPSERDRVKLVHAYLKINVNPQRSPGDFVLESDITLRNLKDNL